jgi:type I restriction-modification system DNA methylase subunit
MPAPEIIRQLVERYKDNSASYHSSVYNETQARREFIDPLFKALGWDMDNVEGYAEAYKDVIHEDAIKVGGATKAPDYAFRIGGTRKFFVEAKKPSVNIKGDISPAFQLRRYAWSAKLPLSILTDFEEFAVYDCRDKPDKSDKAGTGRTLFLTYDKYLEHWDEIAATFSKQAVLKGSFDKYAEGTKGKRGTSDVDDAFLIEISRWRDLLAHNLAIRNLGLTQRELNYSVQMTIDRIIFLRICEDRGIEPYGKLEALTHAGNVYTFLLDAFRSADQRYNSGLFHFQKEKGRGTPDELSAKLALDDKPLKDIIQNLYYPDSPYEFSVLPVEILGQVYEQFLGKVIRLTAGHHAVVEDKPEVKKAGGVFYTPTYIVEYIVRQTLTPALTLPGRGSVRVLDPACGSGSFLLGAYQFLLDWQRDRYVSEGEKWAKGKNPRLYQAQGGEWKLTTAERKRILLEHIYGVDIDPQAVEVTKLSLLLKVLEGESQGTISGQMSLLQERALPDLSRNIKCGNSLIGPDFYTEKQASFLDAEEQYRINAFDWEREFPEVFKDGGFDVVIGNPPYIRIQALKEWAPKEVEFYKQRYKAASKGNYDIYVVFVEKALSLLNAQGRLGYILPHKFFNSQYGQPLREVLANGKHLAKIVHFGDQQVFENATTYTCLLFLEKAGREAFEFEKVDKLEAWRDNMLLGSLETPKFSTIGTIPAERVTPSEWNFTVGRGSGLFEKLSLMPLTLGDVALLFVGLQTDGDDIFILEEIEKDGNRVLCYSKATQKQHWFEDVHLKPFLKGSLNIRRYHLANVSKRLIFPYETVDNRSVLISLQEYPERFPLTWQYLEQNRDRLSSRNKGKMGKEWYGYVYKKNHTRFEYSKLLAPSIATGSCFAYDSTGKYYFVGSGGGGGGGYGISILDTSKHSFVYLLGLLNSRLLSAFLKQISTPYRGGYIALNRQYIEQLPIRPIDFTDPADAARHRRMVGLVERMLGLHEELGAVKTPNERTMVERQIETVDGQIDGLVYELYGLTEEEVRVVEGK